MEALNLTELLGNNLDAIGSGAGVDDFFNESFDKNMHAGAMSSMTYSQQSELVDSLQKENFALRLQIDDLKHQRHSLPCKKPLDAAEDHLASLAIRKKTLPLVNRATSPIIGLMSTTMTAKDKAGMDKQDFADDDLPSEELDANAKLLGLLPPLATQKLQQEQRIAKLESDVDFYIAKCKELQTALTTERNEQSQLKSAVATHYNQLMEMLSLRKTMPMHWDESLLDSCSSLMIEELAKMKRTVQDGSTRLTKGNLNEKSPSYTNDSSSSSNQFDKEKNKKGEVPKPVSLHKSDFNDFLNETFSEDVDGNELRYDGVSPIEIAQSAARQGVLASLQQYSSNFFHGSTFAGPQSLLSGFVNNDDLSSDVSILKQQIQSRDQLLEFMHRRIQALLSEKKLLEDDLVKRTAFARAVLNISDDAKK